MIASDVNNPNFAGARNPDAGLFVQFYEELVKNEFLTEQQKKPVFEPFDFVWIQSPGDQLNVVKTFARDEHKNRFPKQWAAYQERSKDNDKIVGTPLSEWPRVTKLQCEELRGMRFYTVEAIANASDAQLNGIGMIAGQSAFTFRDAARQFLSVAQADAQLSEAAETLRRAKEEAAAKEEAMRQEMAEMKEQMKMLVAAATQQMAAHNAQVEEKRGPGRPKAA
jgi:hypothetical protein